MEKDTRLYTKEHAWARPNGNGCYEIGLSGYAIKELDGIAYVAFETQENDMVKKGDIIASIESRKAVDALHSPVDGIIKVIASHVETDPTCLENCDGDITLAVIQPMDGKVEGLLTREEYDKYTESL